MPGSIPMCDIMGALGQPAFEECLLQSVSTQVSCSHLTAFSITEGDRPKQILAANIGRSEIARDVGARYLERYWHLDPLNAPWGYPYPVTQLAVDDILDAEYRHDCYEAVDLIERLSIVHHSDRQWVRLNFYRNRDQGRFSRHERALLEGWAAFLFVAVQKHRSIAPRDGESDFMALAERLRAIAPHLSPREVEVCIDIVLGHTSESIAVKRSLSINTVLTHRRNAYAKLIISSQSELSRLVLRPVDRSLLS